MGTSIGIIHPGEMGAAIGASLVKDGHTVRWAGAGRSGATQTRAEEAGLVDVGSIAALCEQSTVVMSICPPHAAIEVAQAVAGFGGLFLDANAISPATATEVRGIVEAGGARYVDGGVVGSPPSGRERTRLYLSGGQADDVAALFIGDQLVVKVLSERPTAASALKMSYAAWTKGTAALILDIVGLARFEGVEADLFEEWAATSPDLPGRAQRAAQSAATKGWRWVGEMEEIALSFRTAGLPDGFHEASAEIYRRSPREEQAAADAATLDAVVRAVTAGPAPD
jgi:3-hydroxyisobutyrate dehydrogenase-like beta-hydroxyacid dehydrogenase